MLRLIEKRVHKEEPQIGFRLNACVEFAYNFQLTNLYDTVKFPLKSCLNVMCIYRQAFVIVSNKNDCSS